MHHESFHQFPYPFPGLLIRQTTGVINLFLSIRDHDLRTVHGMHVEEDHGLAEMILRPGGSEHADGSPHDCDRFAVPGIVSVWP